VTLTALLAVILVALATTVPAAALRSGPDVAIPAGVDIQLSWGGGAGVRPAGAGQPPRSEAGYMSPVPGVDPPSGVERLFDPPEEEWGAGHRGVDLTAPAGSRVVSPGPGVVTFAGQVARRGVVVVTHPDGLRTSLEPVAASVPVGTAVAAGTVIGVVEGGHTGGGGTTPNHCAPRSCVHWGVRRGERYIDPLSLLDRPQIVLLPDR
jgi:murein DD-endopeptidase MepM/ murein hydrolase activator NlpD